MSPSPPFKAHFLGPNAENEAWLRQQFDAVLDDWFQWRRDRFPGDPAAITAADLADPRVLAARAGITRGLADMVAAWREEIPTYSPRYIAHMVSDFALPALLGHFAALLHNPNICSKEAAKVGATLETEAIAQLAEMVGFDPRTAHGHFTSGGTVANLEAVWRARYRLDHRLALALTLAEEHDQPLDLFCAAHRTAEAAQALKERYGVSDAAMRRRSAVLNNPNDIQARLSAKAGRPYLGPVILAPGHRHYSWQKAANMFGLGEEALWTAPLDAEGRLSLPGLAARIEQARRDQRPILLVAAVAGTTELGLIDPVHLVADHLDALREVEGIDIWRHVDAAYGGYFCALDRRDPSLGPGAQAALAAIARADTVTIDPHKLGYTPYACGALLAREADTDHVSSFAAPYVERDDLGVPAWASTLEGSRGATGAAAVWLMGRSLGFDAEGHGALVRATLEAAGQLRRTVAAASPQVRLLEPVDTNIFCFSLAKPGEPLSVSNRRTAAAHARIAASPLFSLSKTVLAQESAGQLIDAHLHRYGGVADEPTLTLLRCVVMNPFWDAQPMRDHLTPELTAMIRQAVAEADAETATAAHTSLAPQDH